MNTILLADDDNDFRSVLKNILQDEGYSVIETADGSQAFESFTIQAPDLAILDFQMPGLNGLELTRKIRNINQSIPIILLTGYGDIPKAVSAMKIGAREFLEKPPDFDVLLDIVKTALAGLPETRLSFRELAVLNLIKVGKTNQEIASFLRISRTSVNTYIVRALSKLNAETRAQGVAIAIQKGLISADQS